MHFHGSQPKADARREASRLVESERKRRILGARPQIAPPSLVHSLQGFRRARSRHPYEAVSGHDGHLLQHRQGIQKHRRLAEARQRTQAAQEQLDREQRVSGNPRVHRRNHRPGQDREEQRLWGSFIPRTRAASPTCPRTSSPSFSNSEFGNIHRQRGPDF